MRALVTGGGGLIGRRLVAHLREAGHEVRVFGRNRYPIIEALGATSIVGDIREIDKVREAMGGCEVVFNLAAKLGTWGNLAEFMAVNCDAVAAMLEAARRVGVPRFIHASTPSVVGYAQDVENGPQDLPYATRHLSPYAESKAAGEAIVLAANGPELATISLRPHLVIGPGDTLTLKPLIERARKGALRVIGDGRNVVDITYADNAAWAFMDARAALEDWRSPCAGKPYFIGNEEPVAVWPFVNALLADVGIPPIEGHISLKLALGLGAAMEALWHVLPLRGAPPITRFMASGLARNHWYDPAPARRDLGYFARVPITEGRRRIAASILEGIAR